MTDERTWVPDDIDVETPSAARLYDYYLGGSYNFASDRALARRIYEVFPQMPHLARVNRDFLRRSVGYLLDQGIRQFLDLGCGLPTAGAVHELAQERDREARVVYVDNEPVAVAHSELMLERNTYAEVIHADLADVDTVFAAEPTRRLLDLDQPLGVLMVAVAHFLSDQRNPAGILAAYRERMPAGSYLVFSHVSGDTLPNVEQAAALYRNSQNPAYLRTRDEIATMLEGGFTLVDPALVFVPAWRPEHPDDAHGAEACSFYGAVGQPRTPASAP